MFALAVLELDLIKSLTAPKGPPVLDALGGVHAAHTAFYVRSSLRTVGKANEISSAHILYAIYMS